MGKVLEFDINPDIVLDESRIVGMPDNIKGNLLATMTYACGLYKCDWTELTWKVKKYDGQPVISVKRKPDVT